MHEASHKCEYQAIINFGILITNEQLVHVSEQLLAGRETNRAAAAYVLIHVLLCEVLDGRPDQDDCRDSVLCWNLHFLVHPVAVEPVLIVEMLLGMCQRIVIRSTSFVVREDLIRSCHFAKIIHGCLSWVLVLQDQYKHGARNAWQDKCLTEHWQSACNGREEVTPDEASMKCCGTLS